MSARPGRGARSALLLDLYELTMGQSYVAEGMHERPATFSLFVRTLPPGWGSFVAAGLDDALDYLETFEFTGDDLAFLEETGLFTAPFLDLLSTTRFSGRVRAMREGTPFFPGEPVLEVDAPMLEAQLVETVVLNEIHYQSLVASKAARSVDVAGGRRLVEFGLRRTHRGQAGMRAARSSYLAGFDATSNVLAGRRYGIPVAGTMAHSYVEAFPDEREAFEAYARAYPDRAILLVDTYDTVAGVRRAAEVARSLAAAGHRLDGVRLDSGDLLALSRATRTILDESGFPDAIIFASGGLDEVDVEALLSKGAPIDGFGIGSRLGTSADTPYLDMAYKLVSYDGRPTLKLSATKATMPGAKQAWRLPGDGGPVERDVLGLAGEEPPAGGQPLLEVVMEEGKRTLGDSLEAARERCLAGRAALPAGARGLTAMPIPVELTPGLVGLRESTAAEARARNGLQALP